MSDQELERVKQILVGDLQVALDSVDAKFEKKFAPEQFAGLVSDVVAEALENRANTDDKVADVLAPTIDQAIAGSIDQDPKKLAESLYPIMGPAIRKSISETLQQMLENFNQLLEESLSPKSLRWRFDAWRTGRSYSELVMLNTLDFQIEQVFLIHRETSLLIQHQISDSTDAKDPDMVSSMFSAIQDFIEDSFSTDETNELNTLRLGDLTVVIQRGPAAVLAAVVRGRVPENLRSDMVLLLESLHVEKRSELSDYSGDPDDFIEIEPQVRSLLQTGKKEEETVERKFPWLAAVSILAALAAFGYWQWLGQQVVDRQQQLIDKLDSEPGIAVLISQTSRSNLSVEIIADPDAVAPEPILTSTTDEYSINIRSIPYLSVDQEIIQRRAERILKLEPTTQMVVFDRSVVLSGVATVDWLADAKTRWAGIAGAETLDIDQLKLVNPALDQINSGIASVESFVFEFETGSADIDPTTAQFQGLVSDLKALQQQVASYDATINIDIVGFTDASGTERVNRVIAMNRAETLKLHLEDAGIPPSIMSAHRSHDYDRALGTLQSNTDDSRTATTRQTRLVVRMMR